MKFEYIYIICCVSLIISSISLLIVSLISKRRKYLEGKKYEKHVKDLENKLNRLINIEIDKLDNISKKNKK